MDPSLPLRNKLIPATIGEEDLCFGRILFDLLAQALSHGLDKLGRPFDRLDEDVAVLGETLSLFVQFWVTITPPLPDSARQSARIKGNDRFEGFMQMLGKRLASGDRFLKGISRYAEESDAP